MVSSRWKNPWRPGQFSVEINMQPSICLLPRQYSFVERPNFEGMPSQRSARINRAARSPIITQGAIVFPVVTLGMIEPSAMRKRLMP